MVGEISPQALSVDLHEIFLVGSAAVLDQTTSVGVSAGNAYTQGAINQIAVLPDGNAVFCVSDLVNQPPLNGHTLGHFDRVTKVVTPIPVPTFVGQSANALAVDRTGTLIYVGISSLTPTVRLFSVPIAGGPATFITNVLGAPSLAVQSNGRILAGSLQNVVEIDPQNGSTVTISTIASTINGLFVEAATDSPIAVLNGLGGSPGVYWVDGSVPNLLATNISGVGSGIAVLNSPRSYGTPSQGTNGYEFALAPAVGGLPLAGNPTFAIRVDAVAGPGNIGILAVAFTPANVQAMGVRVLIDPSTALSVGLLQPGTPVPFVIPAGFPPLRLFYQSFHLDSGAPLGIASTAGMLVGTIR